jgi:malate dehydrogenase (oxaloacetate-decarboxylating)
MIAAAADAVARLSDAATPGAPLLPPMDDLRAVSAAVAIAVDRRGPGAERGTGGGEGPMTAAADEGLARTELHDPIQQIYDAMWRPDYPRIERTWS